MPIVFQELDFQTGKRKCKLKNEMPQNVRTYAKVLSWLLCRKTITHFQVVYIWCVKYKDNFPAIPTIPSGINPKLKTPIEMSLLSRIHSSVWE